MEQNLTLEDSEELHEDIKMYLSLEKLESNLDFWRSLLIVSSSSLESLRLARSIGPAAYATQQLSSASLKNEITKLLSSKTFDQLILLQNQVQRKLTSGENVDVDYWEGLLKELVVWKAKGRLRDMHEIVLNNRLEQLRRKQRDEALRYQDEVQDALKTPGMETEGEVKIEAWDESLEPVQHRKIPDEMRLCEVVDAKADLEKLVRRPSSPEVEKVELMKICSTPFVVRWCRLDSSPSSASSPLSPSPRLLLSSCKLPPHWAKTRRSTNSPSDKDSTRRRSCSISRWRCLDRRTRGRTSIDRGNPGTSTKSTRGTSGTSTTRRTTSESSASLYDPG